LKWSKIKKINLKIPTVHRTVRLKWSKIKK
jgi:hypothetical protein